MRKVHWNIIEAFIIASGIRLQPLRKLPNPRRNRFAVARRPPVIGFQARNRPTYTDRRFYKRPPVAPSPEPTATMKEGRSRPSRYHQYCDDYYVNMNLNTEMELPQTRDTVLHFFEQVKKNYPGMKNFYSRERGEFVLEEDKDKGDYRWASIETRRVSSGFVNPSSVDEAMKQHALVLDLIPYALSVSPLDCESLNVMYGFDYTYRGNHNQLLVDALGLVPAFERMAQIEGATILANEPSIQFALDEDCRTQCRLSIE